MKRTRRTVSFGWTMASQLCGLIIRLASTLILTRLLAPEAFGLLGTAFAFVTTLEWISDCGITPAVMRHPNGADHRVLSTGWWLALYRGLLLSACGIALAWPLASVYETPELAGVLALLALRPALMALRSPGMPRIRRELNYRAVFIDETVITIAGTACSIAFAICIPSVWALVAGTLAGAVAGVAISYVLAPALPGQRDREVTKEIVSFGSRVFVNTLVMALWCNLDRLLGLRLLSAFDVGLYAIAANLAAVADGLFNRFCDLHFSTLSGLPSDERRRYHRRTMSRTFRVLTPVCCFAVVVSPYAVALLYDPRYLMAGPILSILLLRATVRAYGQAEFQILLAEDRVNSGTIGYASAAVTQGLVIGPLTYGYGVSGLAISSLISASVFCVAQVAMACRVSRHAEVGRSDVMAPG